MHPFVILLAGYLLCGCKQAQRNRKDRSEKKKEIYRKIKDIEETQGKKKEKKRKENETIARGRGGLLLVA